MKRAAALIATVVASAFASAASAGLIAYYPFNGGSVADASGNAVVTTNSGAVAATGTGYYGDGLSFDGVDDFVRLELDINPTARPKLTMGAWVKATNVSPIRQVISHDNANFDRSIGIDTRGGGGTNWSAFRGTGVVSSGVAATTNEWVFLAAAYDNTAGTMRFHVNGTHVTAATTFNPGWTFTYLGDNPSFTEHFAGLIDEVFFFDETLTVEQIENIRINGIPEPTALGLLAGVVPALMRRSRR